ncbi:hypothetical protein LAJ19_21475 (plasmid) [Deinococcus taeanensis]|uniref:hypothetical protein n=1 Tax=Deinococcus taeanensis TaxID=2737050 RepID=UPI001CDBC604|nr:hypothetical protein [Deinococcus taeanensis]UBV45556.1 hypothetical protein LAJ19_21475 [Deinococcus taeanensis]
MTQTLTVFDLKSRPWAILRALADGQDFLLLEAGRPVGRLVPCPAEPSTGAPTLAQSLSVDALCALLGDEDLSRLSGVTAATFALARSRGTFPAHVQARLEAVSAAVALQLPLGPATRIRTWWRRPHPELAGRSPLAHLALAWTPGDAHSEQVFRVIQRQDALQQLTLRPGRPERP